MSAFNRNSEYKNKIEELLNQTKAQTAKIAEISEAHSSLQNEKAGLEKTIRELVMEKQRLATGIVEVKARQVAKKKDMKILYKEASQELSRIKKNSERMTSMLQVAEKDLAFYKHTCVFAVTFLFI